MDRQLTRRARARTVAALCCVLILAACTGDDSEPEPTGGAAQATSGAATEKAQGRFEQLLSEHREVDFDPGDEQSPVEAYAAALASHEADFSECERQTDADDRDCQRPSSLTEDLEETINVELLLDASGSMADAASGGTKMQVAQRVLSDFAETLPKDANVSLRVFGQEGSGSAADKARSCRSTEQRVPFVRADSPRVAKGIGSVRPAGWTPLARAMRASQRDLARVGKENTSNFVYVLSDGIETCGGNPVTAAKQLSQAGVGVSVNIVGFDVDRTAARQLAKAARSAGGKYADASNPEELTEAFTDYDWQAWTAYYNCATGKAFSDYNDSTQVAYGNYNCVSQEMHREFNRISQMSYANYNELSQDATREYNAISGAATEPDADALDPGDRGAVLEFARERRDALTSRARENRDFVLKTSRDRRDLILQGAKNQRVDLLDDATQQRDRLLEEAREARESAGG